MSWIGAFAFAGSSMCWIVTQSNVLKKKRVENLPAKLAVPSFQDNPNEEFQRKAWETFLDNIKSQVSPVVGKVLFISYAWDDPVDPSMQRWLTQL
jgi:hypothetical protein